MGHVKSAIVILIRSDYMAQAIKIQDGYITTKRPMAFIKDLDKLFSKYEIEKGAGYFRWVYEG